MIGTFGPYMSPSIIPTRLPACASATARFTATVVLPTPPLPAPTAITFFTPATGCRVPSATLAVRTAAVIDTLHRRDAGHARHRGLGLRLHLVFDRTGRRRQLDDERHRARRIDRQRLDEAETDDVATEIGIGDDTKRVEDGSLIGSGHGGLPSLLTSLRG